MYISIPPSPEVENFQIKIYYPTGYLTQPAKPEADMLPSEPEQRALLSIVGKQIMYYPSIVGKQIMYYF